MKMLNQSLENELEESRKALEAAQETSRLAQEQQRQLEAELEVRATLADLKFNEKGMVIDDFRSQADIENMALFDKRGSKVGPRSGEGAAGHGTPRRRVGENKR
jgi:hypothetical protein